MNCDNCKFSRPLDGKREMIKGMVEYSDQKLKEIDDKLKMLRLEDSSSYWWSDRHTNHYRMQSLLDDRVHWTSVWLQHKIELGELDTKLMCKRFPEHVKVNKSHWCAEHEMRIGS